MRILQIIDSLDVGGAERMAVNYANTLADRIEFSGLVATRKEGSLKNHIQQNVSYLFLDKQSAFDISALFKLRTYCKKENIDLIHAHGTSYFTAFLLKMIYPKMAIIWHEHLGARGSKKSIQDKILWVCSKFFSGIIVVNHALEAWCHKTLKFDQVIYLPNFTIKDTTEKPITYLKGNASKRIVCLANLRQPKNHQLLLEVAIRLKESHADWTFHLIGNDLHDLYSEDLKSTIQNHQLENSVYICGLREDINHILGQADIGVLMSSSEGLPVALLEYGMHKLAVVATDVGEIPNIITDGKNGFTVPSNAPDMFYDALVKLMNDTELQEKLGNALHQTILEQHSENAVITKYMNWINKDFKC